MSKTETIEKTENKEAVAKWLALPKGAYSGLLKYEIKKEDILYKANSDYDEEFRFVQNYLILTKDRLVFLCYPYKMQREYSFGGYAGHKMGQDIEEQEPLLRIHLLADVEKLEIIREVSGGALMGIIGGEETFLCRFSNSKMSEMERLTKNLEKIKKDEELKDEDILGKKKHECCPKCGTLYPDQERNICPKCMDKKSLFLRVMKYFFKYKARLAVMFVCYVFIGALNLAWPYLSGTFLYDKVLNKDPELMALADSFGGKFTIILLFAVLTMVVTKLIIQGLGMLHGAMTARIVPEVVAEMKEEIFNSMGKLSISFYNSRQTGALMTRVLDDASEVTGFFVDGLPYIFTNAFTIIATCVIMFSIHPWLALAALFLLPFLTIQSYRMLPRLWTFYGKRHRASRRLNSQLNDSITGARVVKAFGQQEQELKRLGKGNRGVRDAELDVMKYDNKFNALYAIVENLSSFIVWGLGSAIILSGSNLEFGMLVTFAGYVIVACFGLRLCVRELLQHRDHLWWISRS